MLPFQQHLCQLPSLASMKYWLGLWMITFCLQVTGQHHLSGKVQEISGKGLPFANVLLLNANDSSLVKGMLTDEDGNYHLENPKKGQYRLLASTLGYRRAYSLLFTISDNRRDVVIPPLILIIASQQLNEVAVVAQKPLYEQQLDKLIINVQSSITSAGATALDVLERFPGISVNRQAGNLAMNGKEGVMVMINGKLSRLPTSAVVQMLSGMNAGTIEKIELLATPPAGFDAEGNAGLINIILKTNSEYGTNGSYSLTAGYNWHEKAAASFTLNHRTQKLNLFSEYSFMYNSTGMLGYDNRQFTVQNDTLNAYLDLYRDIKLVNQSARVGFDYSLSPKTSIGTLVTAFSNSFGVNSWNASRFFYRQQVIDTLINVEEEGSNRWYHLMGNVNLRHKLSNKDQLSIDLDYLYYYNRNPRLYTSRYQYQEPLRNYTDQVRLDKNTPISLWVGKADYVKNPGAGMRLEAGIKATLSHVQNDVSLETFHQGQWQTDEELTQSVFMRENIGAGYISFQQQIDAKTKLQTGLRYEYSHTLLTNHQQQNLLERRNGWLFPTLFVSRDFSKQHSLQFSYSRRVMRPTYNDLAPYVVLGDRYTFYSGNIRLKPTLSDIIRIGYRLREKYLWALQYSHDKNAISSWQVRVDPQTRKQFTYPENIDQVNTLSLSLSFPWQVGSFWQMQHTVTGNWQGLSTYFEGNALRLSRFNSQINWTHTVKMPHQLTLELSGFYQTPSLWGMAIRNAYGTFNMGLQKQFTQDKGILRLSVEDLFWTLPHQKFEYNQPEKGFTRRIFLRSEPRVIRLTFSRNFGNKNLKTNSRSTASEEERKRVGN